MSSRPHAIAIGISTPWDLADLDPADQRAQLGTIADVGIDHVFTADHVSFHGGSGIDGVVRLASLGGMEPRLGLHLGVFLLALRHPVVAARQIATLAELAPGRLTVGIGVGGEDRHEFEVCDVDPATRGRRTDVALGMLRSLLAGRSVDGDGEFFGFEDARVLPAPDPPVPLVVGGRSNAALDRAGRLGDGWLAAWCSPRRFRDAVARVESHRSAPAGGWRHGLQFWLGVGDDPADARVHVARRMEAFYRIGFEAFERYTPMGTAEDIAEFLHPYVEAGASTLNLTPCGADRHVEAETLAEVGALLRSTTNARTAP